MHDKKLVGRYGLVVVAASLWSVIGCGSGGTGGTGALPGGAKSYHYTGHTGPAPVTQGNAVRLGKSLATANTARERENLILQVSRSLVEGSHAAKYFKGAGDLGSLVKLPIVSNCAGDPGTATVDFDATAVPEIGKPFSAVYTTEYSHFCYEVDGKPYVIHAGKAVVETSLDGLSTSNKIEFSGIDIEDFITDGTLTVTTAVTPATETAPASTQVTVAMDLVNTNKTETGLQSKLNLRIETTSTNAKISGELCQSEAGCVSLSMDGSGNIEMTGADGKKIQLTAPGEGEVGYKIGTIDGAAPTGKLENVNINLNTIVTAQQ